MSSAQSPRYAVLNPDQHGELRVRTEHSAALGDALMQCMIFPFEFRNVQASYPILFQKNPETGEFYPLALFGFEQGQNLFLSDAGWEPVYVPVMMRRQPLLIGFQAPRDAPAPATEAAGASDARPVVSIDLHSPRLSTEHGEPLFLPHGGASEFLADMIDRLESIHRGHQQNTRLSALLQEHGLLEPFALDVTLDNGEHCQLIGFYAINEQTLQNLSGTVLQTLQQAGALAPVFMAVAAQSQFRPLLARRNAR